MASYAQLRPGCKLASHWSFSKCSWSFSWRSYQRIKQPPLWACADSKVYEERFTWCAGCHVYAFWILSEKNAVTVHCWWQIKPSLSGWVCSTLIYIYIYILAWFLQCKKAIWSCLVIPVGLPESTVVQVLSSLYMESHFKSMVELASLQIFGHLHVNVYPWYHGTYNRRYFREW